MNLTILMLIFLGLAIFFLVRSEKKRKKWEQAFDLHKSMYNKYIDLAENDFLSEKEWKGWLPIFEEVDRIFARDCPDLKLEPISQRIRKIINDEESIED